MAKRGDRRKRRKYKCRRKRKKARGKKGGVPLGFLDQIYDSDFERCSRGE